MRQFLHCLAVNKLFNLIDQLTPDESVRFDLKLESPLLLILTHADMIDLQCCDNWNVMMCSDPNLFMVSTCDLSWPVNVTSDMPDPRRVNNYTEVSEYTICHKHFAVKTMLSQSLRQAKCLITRGHVLFTWACWFHHLHRVTCSDSPLQETFVSLAPNFILREVNL